MDEKEMNMIKYERLNKWLMTDLLIEQKTDSRERMKNDEWEKQWSERSNEYLNGLLNEWLKERKNKCMKEWMNEK